MSRLTFMLVVSVLSHALLVILPCIFLRPHLSTLWVGGGEKGDGGEDDVTFINLKSSFLENNSPASGSANELQQNQVTPQVPQNKSQLTVSADPQKQKTIPKKSPVKAKAQKSQLQKTGSPLALGSTKGLGNGSGGAGLDSSGSTAQQSPHIVAQIRRQIYQRKHYPSSARQNQITGNVKVAFQINAQGGLQFVRVLSSSGSALLDEAAITSVKRAAPFPFYPQVMHIVLEYNLQ